MSELLKASHIHKSYLVEGQELEILQDVDLVLQKGEVHCIMGASGSGKSTLLHILGSLDKPTKGEVFFEGRSLSRVNDKTLASFRNEKLGFVFQFHHLLPEFTALENVLIPVWIGDKKRDQKEYEKRALHLLEFTGLSKRLHHRPYELSGGENQRVALARALILEPTLILADEPTGNLDAGNAHQVFELLLKLHQDTKTSILFVTHNNDLLPYATKKWVLQNGQLK